MKFEATILIVGVFLVNYSYNWIAARSTLSPDEIFYVFQQEWVAVISLYLLHRVLSDKTTIWKNLIVVALVISTVESLQGAVCELPLLGVKPWPVPRGVNICDFVTGLPVGFITTLAYGVLVGWLVGSYLYRRLFQRKLSS